MVVETCHSGAVQRVGGAEAEMRTVLDARLVPPVAGITFPDAGNYPDARLPPPAP